MLDDRYDCLLQWQVHVYGDADETLRCWCTRNGTRLHEYPWTARHEQLGITRNATLLVRPDTYIAVATAAGATSIFDRYLADRRRRHAH